MSPSDDDIPPEALRRLLNAVFGARRVTVELSPDATAINILALHSWREEQREIVDACREIEGVTRAAMPDSETYQAGVVLASTDNLIDVMDRAVAVSVTLVLPAEDEDETRKA